MNPYQIDFSNFITPFHHADVNSAGGGVAGLEHYQDAKRQQSQFDTTDAFRKRELAGSEYRDQRDYDTREADKRQALVAGYSTMYQEDPEKADAIFAPIFQAHGWDLSKPGATDELLKADAEIRKDPGVAPPEAPPGPSMRPGEDASSFIARNPPRPAEPDAPAPTSRATGQVAPGFERSAESVGGRTVADPAMEKPAEFAGGDTLGSDGERRMSGEDAALADLAAAQAERDLSEKSGPASGVEEPPNPKDTQSRNLPKKPAAALAEMGKRIEATPEPQPDLSVQPPEEIANALKGPLTPGEMPADQYRPPISGDWKHAPANPGGGPVITEGDYGRSVARMPSASSIDATRQARWLGEAQTFVKELPYPENQKWAAFLEEGIKSGAIRTRADLTRAEEMVLGTGKAEANAAASRAHGGGGRDITLTWDSGRKAAEDEMKRLEVPQFEQMQRSAEQARALLAKGDINSLNAVRYEISKLNDPKGIVTKQDFEAAGAPTLWEKMKDFFLANGDMPTLSPEEVQRMGAVVEVLAQKARERMADADSQLSEWVTHAPPGGYQEGAVATLGAHFKKRGPAGQRHSKVTDGPPL